MPLAYRLLVMSFLLKKSWLAKLLRKKVLAGEWDFAMTLG